MTPSTQTPTPHTETEIMTVTSPSTDKRSARWFVATTGCALFALGAGYAQVCLAGPSTRTFGTPEEAVQALYQTVERGDATATAAILGTAREGVATTDRAQDRLDRGRFVQKYRQMHRLVHEPDATTVLTIGAENWPFPVPLVSENGVWRFDAQRGLDEVVFRRIGENELSAAQACRALVLASQDHGRPERDPSMRSLRQLRGSAAGAGVRYHGYVFRALANPGADGSPGAGPAYIAYPAQYGSTGVMSFLVGPDGVVYARDLGRDSARAARQITEYRRDPGWKPEE
jgi:hypothetical protein